MPSTNVIKIKDPEKQALASISSALSTTPSQSNKNRPSQELRGHTESKMSKITHIFLCCVLLFVFTFTVSSAAAHGAIKAVSHEEQLRFQELLDSVEPAALHEVLHEHMKDKYQHGVYQEDKTAMEVVHKTKPKVAQSLVELAKRQSNATLPAPPPSSSTTPAVVVPNSSTTPVVPVTPSTTPNNPSPTPSTTQTQQQTSQAQVPTTAAVQTTPNTALTTRSGTTAVVPPTTTPTTRASSTPPTAQRSSTNGELPKDMAACPLIPPLPASPSSPESLPAQVPTDAALMTGSAAPSAQPFYSPVLVSTQNPSIDAASVSDSAAFPNASPTNLGSLRPLSNSATNSVYSAPSPPYKNTTFSVSLPPFPIPSNSSLPSNYSTPASDFNSTSGPPSVSDSPGTSLPSSGLPSSSIVPSPSSSVASSTSRGSSLVATSPTGSQASTTFTSSTARQTSSVVDSSNQSIAPSTFASDSASSTPPTSRSVTQLIVYTTTQANGAPTTVTSVTIVPADQAENTGSASKTNPNASLQTNGGNARNHFGLTGVLGAIGVVVFGAL